MRVCARGHFTAAWTLDIVDDGFDSDDADGLGCGCEACYGGFYGDAFHLYE